MSPTPAELLSDLQEEMAREFPRFRLISKDRSPLSKVIHRVLVVLTFGQMRAYLDGYQTTLGQRVYVTADWDQRDPRDRYITLRHERIHMRQFRRYTIVGMALLYVFLPLPMGLAYFRARFEMEAYAESIRAAADVYGPKRPQGAQFRRQILHQFTGPSYGWMWPFPTLLNRWYDKQIAALSGGEAERR